MKAPQCAGVIHSDFERGFIRAETVSYDDLLEAGSHEQLHRGRKSKIRRKRICSKRRRCYAFPL